MTVALHQGAERDVLEATRFYRREGGHKLAIRFLDEFERVIAMLDDNPGFGTPIDELRRVFPLRGFPYSVIYHALGEDIRILVVRHQRRDSDHGGQRT